MSYRCSRARRALRRAPQFCHDSTLHALRYYNGSTWVDLTSSSSDAEMLDGQLPTFYLGRANHTGVQTASTISDFCSGDRRGDRGRRCRAGQP